MELAEQDKVRQPVSFAWARLGSFVSLLPLGVWTVNHLWDNLAAFSGAAAWEKAVTHHKSPVGHTFTLLIVFLPLIIHTIWGVRRLTSFRPNNVAYPTLNNLKYLLQRIAAVGVLFFLGAHIWLAMLRPRLLLKHPETFADIAREMHWHTPTLVVYLLGTLGVAFHLANGISSFAWTWGLMAGRRSFVRFDWIAGVSFFALLAMAWGAVYALWSAGAIYGP